MIGTVYDESRDNQRVLQMKLRRPPTWPKKEQSYNWVNFFLSILTVTKTDYDASLSLSLLTTLNHSLLSLL